MVSNFALLSEYEKEKFYYTLKEDLETFNAFVMVCHNQNLAGSLNLYEVVYENQLNMKALLLGSINKRKNAIVNSGDAELMGLQIKLEEARARLSASYYSPEAGSQVVELTREVERLDKELNTRTSIGPTSPITWQQVNGTLRGGDCAIEIVRIANVNPTTGVASDGTISYLILMNTLGEPPAGFRSIMNESWKTGPPDITAIQ